MASVPSIITASFDGTAENYKLDQDHKREVDKRRKYALGVTEAGPFSRARPVTPLSAQALKSLKRQAHQYSLPRGKVGAKFVETSDNAASDSSATEDVDEPSAAPEPDADITYSFDAARGPTPSGEILSLAINKAVERFENKETEKLVRNEYNVVAKDEEEEQGGYTADDDFELV